MAKKLNAVTLSGLMIGPILGSGILFLPPLAYEKLGNRAIVAWMITMAMGVLFAYVFSRMNAAAPDNRGVSAVIGGALGKWAETLAANYLTAAVFFGPVAVSLIVADFIGTVFPAAGISRTLAAGAVLIVCALIVLADVGFIGKLVLALSSLAACLLLAGGVITIAEHPAGALPQTLPRLEPLGSTLLLLFWAILGWEVLGNYAEDVADPKRTTMRAMKISLVVIIAVYMVVALALQKSGSGDMAALLSPLFGRYAAPVFGALAAGLCICTVVMFTGAVTRQTAARLQTRRVLPLLKKNKAPVFALFCVNLLVLLCHTVGWLSFENIVESTNSLFIGNAFLGLLSGWVLIRNIWIRVSIGVLLLMLLVIFLFSPLYAIVFFGFVTLVSLLSGRRIARGKTAAAD